MGVRVFFTGAVIRCIVCGFGDTCDHPSPRSLFDSRRRFSSMEFHRYRSATGAHRLAQGRFPPRRILVVSAHLAADRPAPSSATLFDVRQSIDFGGNPLRGFGNTPASGRYLRGGIFASFALSMSERWRAPVGRSIAFGGFPSDICTSNPIRFRETS